MSRSVILADRLNEPDIRPCKELEIPPRSMECEHNNFSDMAHFDTHIPHCFKGE